MNVTNLQHRRHTTTFASPADQILVIRSTEVSVVDQVNTGLAGRPKALNVQFQIHVLVQKQEGHLAED